MFVHGRTETIRTLTVDSRAWVLSMVDPMASVRLLRSSFLFASWSLVRSSLRLEAEPLYVTSQRATRHMLLHRALKTHGSLTREAATGRGIDRHLLGLRLMLVEVNNGPRPKMFEDELFERSQTWKLSTSGLSAGHHFRGTG